MRNKEMTVLKALGIILVVMGHKFGTFVWFPPYSFHMTLFLFVSGYFYNPNYENNQVLFFKKRFKTLILPYFAYELLYACITFFLFKRYNILLGSIPTLKNFFLTPFTTGSQYLLYLAAWFMIYLFIIQTIFLYLYKYLKKVTDLKIVHFMLFLLMCIVATYMAKLNLNQGINLIIVKVLFGLFFYYLGMFYRHNLENKNIFKTSYILVVFVVQVLILLKAPKINYVLVTANFNSYVFVPIIVSCNGIFIYTFLAKAISKVIDDNDLLIKIGNNTFHIMANHLLIFFIINFIFVKINKLDIKLLNDVFYSYQLTNYWLIYITLGVLIPTFTGAAIKHFKNKFMINNINNRINVSN